MENILSLAQANLTSPMVLCFILGMFAALIRSDLSIPQAIAKGMSIYLLFAIGFKGGVEIARFGLTPDLAKSFFLGIFLSFTIPILGFKLLRATTKLSAIDAAAISAHYGSISIVTFVAATQTLELAGVEYDGAIVAVAAAMEAPAIISALFLLRRTQKQTAKEQNQGKAQQPLTENALSDPMPMREVFFNGSIVLLCGAFCIGFISGEKGFASIKSLIADPFKGVLCFFLLDMGLIAGRHFKEGMKYLKPKVILFGIYMPLLSAFICAGLGYLLGINGGSLALLITLSASASYIAVPAALRIALPKANPAVYLTMSLAVTFPFNLTIGIPTYFIIAQSLP